MSVNYTKLNNYRLIWLLGPTYIRIFLLVDKTHKKCTTTLLKQNEKIPAKTGLRYPVFKFLIQTLLSLKTNNNFVAPKLGQ